MPPFSAAFTTPPPYAAAAHHVARFDYDYIKRAAIGIDALDSIVSATH